MNDLVENWIKKTLAEMKVPDWIVLSEGQKERKAVALELIRLREKVRELESRKSDII